MQWIKHCLATSKGGSVYCRTDDLPYLRWYSKKNLGKSWILSWFCLFFAAWQLGFLLGHGMVVATLESEPTEVDLCNYCCLLSNLANGWTCMVMASVFLSVCIIVVELFTEAFPRGKIFPLWSWTCSHEDACLSFSISQAPAFTVAVHSQTSQELRENA